MLDDRSVVTCTQDGIRRAATDTASAVLAFFSLPQVSQSLRQHPPIIIEIIIIIIIDVTRISGG
jgi:hypothetical protein